MTRWIPLALAACTWGYGPPVDASRFENAVMHEDGRRCVFGHHARVYRPAAGLRAFPDGGIPWWRTDRHEVGVVDVSTGEMRILWSSPNRDFAPGQGAPHVVGVVGRGALVSQGGQRRRNLAEFAVRSQWIALDTGAHTELPLADELAALGRRPTTTWIADDAPTLVVVTEPLRAGPPRDAWVRDAHGLRRLAVSDHLYGVRDGLLWWYDPTRGAGITNDVHTGAEVVHRRADFALPRADPTRACGVTAGGTALEVQERGPSGWRRRRISPTL